MHFAILLTLLAIPSSAHTLQNGSEWKQKIEAAKPSQIIELPAGTISVGDVTVPPGVHVRGAGAEKTTLVAAGYKDGFVLCAGSTLSELTVRAASENGVHVTKATGVSVSCVKTIACLTGLLVDHADRFRGTNLVLAKNRSGASLFADSASALINCTIVDNIAIGLTVSRSNHVTIFNNVIVNSPTAVNLADNNMALSLDHNLYVANNIGKLEGEVARTTLPGWQRITGQDAHTLSLAVEFKAPKDGDYSPKNSLYWAPSQSVVSGWAVPAQNGIAAPGIDIMGQKRHQSVGAYEPTLPSSRPPDGFFNIVSADGVKSAGLFTHNGVRLASLFQNLPLPHGKHDFWVPARDDRNSPIPPGSYELRVVESHLSNIYLGLAGNFGQSSNRLDNCSWAEEMFAFDAEDRIYIAQNSFENGMGVRAFDTQYTVPRWMMPGGGGTVGIATDSRWLYYLQKSSKDKYNLRRIELETGKMGKIGPTAGNLMLTFSDLVHGMAVLDGKLYVSDTGKGRIVVGDCDDPHFSEVAALPGVASITADVSRHRLWAFASADRLWTLDTRSRTITLLPSPVPGLQSISACNGKLALLATITGKIHIYDCTDPGNLRPTRTIGTGDGPYGPIKPDRFWFQRLSAKAVNSKLNVAINARGEIAVVDGQRVSYWAADGTLKKQGLGFWGQHNTIGRLAGDDDIRCWDINGTYSIKFDSKNRRWSPDTHWELPPYTYDDRAPRHFFTVGGKNFGVYAVRLGDPGKMPDGKLRLTEFDNSAQTTGVLVVRLDEHMAVPVSLYFRHSTLGTLVEIHDTNQDGIIDGKDKVIEVRAPGGGPTFLPDGRYGTMPGANGNLMYTNTPDISTTGTVVRMTGLDPSGTYPVYAWDRQEKISCRDKQNAQFVSPYDYKTPEFANRTVQLAPLSDGGYASSVQLSSSGGTGLANGAGTDIAGIGNDGLLRWLTKFDTTEGTEGVQSIPKYGLILGMMTTQCDYMVLDEDGLGMGALSMPRESHWGGMWSDHAQQQQAWVGNDGKPYYLLGDYSVNGLHWFAINGTENTIHHRISVRLDKPHADALASQPDLLPRKVTKPPTVKVTIPRLAAPLTIDGNLGKWRAAGIAPLTLITPDTGTPDIIGPKDCSAVVRMAYYGTDLYVQTIVFDDVVTFHQPLEQMNAQDGMEFIINSFMSGFKYNVAITTDHGPTVYRNKFVQKQFDRIYTDTQVPRSIKVLDNAEDVEERRFIESIYGVDLARSHVIVTEFKLPLTAAIGLDGDPSVLPDFGPGKSFWIGFLINDNDIPGGEIQKYMVWPSTYGNFNVKEAGALATLEQ